MSEDVRRQLERVGEQFDLGEYEIEAYLAVLDRGRLTADEIADRTDVPQLRVYGTVRSLADRGLVELQESRPLEVVAVDPEEALGDLQASLSTLAAGLSARYTAPTRGTEAVSLVRSRSTVLRHLTDTVEAAEFELELALTPDLLGRFEDDLRDAVDRGVTVDLLVAPADRAPDAEAFVYGDVASEARTRQGITTPVVVVAVADGERSVYATQDALRADRDRYGVVFERSALGFLVSGFYRTVPWTTAEETLHAAADLQSLPRRYASVRRCVADLPCYREAGGELYAAVEGRDVETGAPRVVRGRVAETRSEGEEVATLAVESDDGPVTVGGQVAAYEDVEAHEIRVDRDALPSPAE
ncbi:ArsR family transcriptional regulator [Halobacteriales archaeon SW_5_70_135]|nr:MAG: ArsR family transcriptional regulator [Halobacteriales archaeon SW_5_70_135]